jgi:hypothetical protein
MIGSLVAISYDVPILNEIAGTKVESLDAVFRSMAMHSGRSRTISGLSGR